MCMRGDAGWLHDGFIKQGNRKHLPEHHSERVVLFVRALLLCNVTRTLGVQVRHHPVGMEPSKVSPAHAIAMFIKYFVLTQVQYMLYYDWIDSCFRCGAASMTSAALSVSSCSLENAKPDGGVCFRG